MWVVRKKEEKRNEEVAMTNDKKTVKEHLSAFGGKVALSVIERASAVDFGRNRNISRKGEKNNRHGFTLIKTDKEKIQK